MDRNLNIKTKLAGVESTINIIAELVKKDAKLKSGIFGLNDRLELISTKQIYDSLDNSRIFHILSRLENCITAVVIFVIFENEPFSVSQKLISKLVSACEAARISLLDIICYSQQGSASLRQQNLL